MLETAILNSFFPEDFERILGATDREKVQPGKKMLGLFDRGA